MKKLLLVLGLVSALLVFGTGSSVSAVGDTQLAGAASGTFPSGAAFAGIPLSGSTLGLGVIVDSAGGAVGDFAIVLEGTSLLGEPQSITLEGKPTAGLADASGSTSFSGVGTLDMGDGSVPVSVPFSATVTGGALELTIGTTALPTQTLSAGSIYVGQ
jgi:hypothetical protein